MDGTSSWQALGRFSFGDSPAMADELLHLVQTGAKTATCWPGRDGPKVKPGWRLIVTDSAGRDGALIEISDVESVAFDRVGADFARAEGEGDRTLASWRVGHQAYFARNGGYSSDMPVWCCRFTLVASGLD